MILFTRHLINVAVTFIRVFSQTNEFDWGPELRGAVLSSFFYGYISTQLIGGVLSAKLGGVKLIGYGIAGTAVLTVLTPVAARYSVYLVLALRVVEGVFEVSDGFIFIAFLHTLSFFGDSYGHCS